MSNSKEFFHEIQNLLSQNENVAPGKMMSSDGITYKSKVFAFYYNNSMVFKLGKEYNLDDLGITDWEWLNPFKKKPPLKGWYVIKKDYQDKWYDLAKIAYDRIQDEIK